MNDRPVAPQAPPEPQPGLCAACRHATRVPSSRGAMFWRCERSASDPGYARYPVLPVLACRGYEPSSLEP